MRESATISLAELAEVNPKTDLRGLNVHSSISFIPMSDVTERGQWLNRQERSLDDVRVGYSSFAEGDVLFAKITPCMENGKGAHAVNLKNGVGFGSTEFHVLRRKGVNSARFIFHWLQSQQLRLRATAYMGGSAGQQRVQTDFFSNYRVLSLRPDEQSRIAAVLDTVDEAIAKAEAVIAKLRQVRAGLLHDLLTRGLDEHGQLRDPVAHPEQFQNSPIGRIPKAWDWGPLRAYSRTDRPYLKTGPFGSNLKQEHWVSEGVPVVTIGSLGEGSFIHSELLHVSSETALELQSYALKTGDIVFSRVADVGRSVVVTDAECGWIMSSNMMWIALDECKVVPNYVQTQIAHSPVIRSQIRAFVNAGGRDVANSDVMNALCFFWPPKPEQEATMEILTGLNRQIAAEEFVLAKNNKLKSGLMDDLLMGRVRVPEAIRS